MPHPCFFSPPSFLSSPLLVSQASVDMPVSPRRVPSKRDNPLLPESGWWWCGAQHKPCFAISVTKLFVHPCNSCLEIWAMMAQVTQKPLEPCPSYPSPGSVPSLATSATAAWHQPHYRESLCLTGEQISMPALGHRVEPCSPPTPVNAGHLSLCATMPGLHLLLDILGSFLVPSKTPLPGQHGIFQALLLW